MSQTQGPKKPSKNEDIEFNQLGKKFTKFVQTAGQELKRTTAIGKKMLSASKSNSILHEKYEKLGVLVEAAVKSGELSWENLEAHKILKQIDELKVELDKYEDDVRTIKTQK